MHAFELNRPKQMIVTPAADTTGYTLAAYTMSRTLVGVFEQPDVYCNGRADKRRENGGCTELHGNGYAQRMCLNLEKYVSK